MSSSSQLVRRAKKRIVEVVLNSKTKAGSSAKERCLASESSSSEDEDVSSYTDYEENEEESSVEDDEQNVPSSSALTPCGTPGERSYRCRFASCGKAYTKPCRLAEHMRSHTGERPFACKNCNKSYLRESHLQAHARSHLPESERPLQCTHEGCCKRFWTPQHLNFHISAVHNKEKSFICTEENCKASFSKHSQLRQHAAETHCPAGTKPYRCTADNCTKSFSTNQKLRAHSKTHEDRYACTDLACRVVTEAGSSTLLYFTTWSALQMHLRQKHPPTCPYDECDGRTFTRRTYLKNHLKLHQEKETTKGVTEAVGADGNAASKSRRGGELGRDWPCTFEDCTKAFKSKKALSVHTNITHLGRRDFVCPHPGCGETFGYKHLLQRHEVKAHSEITYQAEEVLSSSDSQYDIDWITGKNYILRSGHNNTRRPLVPCPWPNRFDLTMTIRKEESIEKCSYIFSRAYDLRRHLKAEHSLELTKDEVDAWVKAYREKHPL
ncbi:hypothetical protein Clacol_000813 [Clathrus columnatus]|uniref:C2H2-type domain-containing protein n=1 Tax=Clathrus columnatus TaxID=1419009 RepID=A0AAV5A0S2_9AGAM|nr:hypothetical protein Clacol_000813 [Clathrus columnatus]